MGLLVVEQYRLLHGMLQVIQEVNAVTGVPICNESTCPTMSAGRYVGQLQGLEFVGLISRYYTG